MKFALLLLTLAGPVFARASEAPLNPTATKITFTGHAFLHDFDGQAKDFEGGARLDPADPNFVTAAVIDVATQGMTSFQTTRDRNMRTWLQVDTDPRIEFRLNHLDRVSGDPAHATREQPARFVVLGDFTLNRTTRPLTATVMGWRENGQLVVTGALKIDTTDYGLPIIHQLFMTVGRNVDVAFRLVFDLPPELTK